jgi:choline dehydrogenase
VRLADRELEDFIRNAAVTYWHETCTAKIGRDAMSAVDGSLRAYGVERLRIADGSVMPRVTVGKSGPGISCRPSMASLMRWRPMPTT